MHTSYVLEVLSLSLIFSVAVMLDKRNWPGANKLLCLVSRTAQLEEKSPVVLGERIMKGADGICGR